MEEDSSRSEKLYARIQQLEQERDELHKQIEQLCTQQAGSSYINVATQMHFRRTAGLEQEIENLKKTLASCAKENLDFKRELLNAKRNNMDLDRLNKLAVTKNTEIVEQFQFLRGVVATTSAERDDAMTEAVKAKENEDVMSQRVNDAEKRLLELTFGSIETQEQLVSLHDKLSKQNQEMDMIRKIIDKFYKIRQHACREIQEEESSLNDLSDNPSWEDTCACLYNDLPEAWSFNAGQEASTAKYMAVLQEKLETLRLSIDDRQYKLQRILSNKLITGGISSLREYHAQQRIQIMDLLNDGKSYLQAAIVSIAEKLGDLSKGGGSAVVTEVSSSVPNIVLPTDTSKAMGQALQEKVSALLLLSQQEESHLLEVRTALRGTLDELQMNLKQATKEKVDALMELAQVKQEYQLLLEGTIQEKEESLTNLDERLTSDPGRDGRHINMLRKTFFKRWLSANEKLPPIADPHVGHEGTLINSRSNHSMDDARLQIENATLKDNMRSLKCLTSNIHKLRLSLIKAKETQASEVTSNATLRLIDEIMWEAELVKNSLGNPFWPGEGEVASSGDEDHEDSNFLEKIDSVSAPGLEMVELLILAAQMIKEVNKITTFK